MRSLVLALCLVLALPAAAQEMPRFPKAGPPEPLPDASCDTAMADTGEWLVGRWVAPMARWEFMRQGAGLVFRLDQKSGINNDFGWREGASITGTVQAVTGCTVKLAASDGGAVFAFDGVLTEGGKIYGAASNKAGQSVRYVLRRER